MTVLKMNHVNFSYPQKPVFSDFSMELQDGEILAVMGESGCGKSTLLALAAGLLRAEGEILTNAEQIAFMFQEPRLLPWCTVNENLAAVLKKNKKSTDEVASVLSKVGLEGCKDLYPNELSGGMKSRVALARAMLYGGDLYLLDEPFAALDESMSASLSVMLRQHIKERGASAILVTHQSSVAQTVADRILNL